MTYPQLDERCLALLREAVTRLGSITAVAARLEYARSSVSMALKGCYPGDAQHLASRIMDIFADHVACPHVGHEIPTSACRAHRDRPLSTANRELVKQWQACRACPINKGDGSCG
ncbi:MAG TPA: LysR family transcriptional regulator [Ancylobacter sp.]